MSRQVVLILPNGKRVKFTAVNVVAKNGKVKKTVGRPRGLLNNAPRDPLRMDVAEDQENEGEYLKTIDEALANLIRKKKDITNDDLDNSNLTAVLRLAGVRDADGKLLFPVVSLAVEKRWNGLRGLPIKLNARGISGYVCLRNHQVLGLKHIRKYEINAYTPSGDSSPSAHGLLGSILRLEMGLGKTLLAIAWSLMAPRPAYTDKLLPDGKPSKFYSAHSEKGFPTLVIASRTVMLEWKLEGFEKFFGRNVKVMYLHKSEMPAKAIASLTRKEIVEYDFVITTYDFVCTTARKWKDFEANIEMGDEHTLMKGKILSVHCRTRAQSDDPKITGARIIFHTPWERVIADESQRFANPDTFTYKAMMSLYGKYKLCLTGTPIRNYNTDIWAQLRWCGYTGVIRKIEWKRAYAQKMREHNLAASILSIEVKDTDIVIPPKKYLELCKGLEDKEKQVYEYAMGIMRNVYDQMMAGMLSFASVLALFTRLRQICIAPYLITAESKREKLKGKEKENDDKAKGELNSLAKGPLSTWIHDKTGTAGIKSCKMRLIVEKLKAIPKGEKVVIFSMFTSCLDLLADAIRAFLGEDYKFEQLDGDTPQNEREDILFSFKYEPEISAVLMTYKVGSEGLNLVSANHVICIEPWWTYAVPAQAEARCHRPGQTKEVIVHNIFIKDSIEQRILEICEGKKQMAKEILDGATTTAGAGLDKYTMGRILGIR